MKLRFARRKKTEQITVETDQILVIRRKRLTRIWCGECNADADFIPVEEINRVIDAGITSLAVGSLHFLKSPDGSTVVCSNSPIKKG